MLVTYTNNTNMTQLYIDDNGTPVSIAPGASAQVSENGTLANFSKLIIREQSGGGYDYTGYALPGTGPAQPGWAIFRVATGSIFPKHWAGKSNRMSNVWNDRASYQYG